MKADIYTGFITDKVKVFGTGKNDKPFVLPKRVFRKAAPFLIASAIVMTACTPKQNDSRRDDSLKSIYAETIERYNLDRLRGKEPFSQEELKQMTANPNPPALTDFNFNHCPASVENFWEIVRNGLAKTREIQNSPRLTRAQAKEYQITAYKMLAQMTRAKGTKDKVDISDYNNLKTFLYFEKVLRFGDNYNEVLSKDIGWIDERDEVFGRYYKDYLALEKAADSYPGVERFARALYNTNDRFILSYADSARANDISRGILKDWLKKQDIKDKNLWYMTDVEADDYANAVAFWYRRGATVGISFGVDSRGNLSEGDYSPVGTIIIHELQHTMQKKPASAESPADNRINDEDFDVKSRFETGVISELGPTLYSLVLEDRIYKKIHGIPQNKAVDYGQIQVGGQKISLGETALWFGKMMDKYPHKSVDKLLQEPEVLKQLDLWGSFRMAHAYRREDSGRG